MATRKTTLLLHAAIRKDFANMSEQGTLRSSHIIELLAKKYYKTTGTIENIVYKSQDKPSMV